MQWEGNQVQDTPVSPNLSALTLLWFHCGTRLTVTHLTTGERIWVKSLAAANFRLQKKISRDKSSIYPQKKEVVW